MQGVDPILGGKRGPVVLVAGAVAKPKPAIPAPTPEQAAPAADFVPIPAEPGKLILPETCDVSKIGKAPVKAGNGMHNLTYDGKPFEAQISATVSRSLSWYDNSLKTFVHKGTPPPGEKRLVCNFDLRQARLAHLPDAGDEAREQKRLHDFVKRVEQANFVQSVPGFVAKLGQKNLPNPVPYVPLYCASAIIGDIEEDPYYMDQNGNWYLKPLSFAVDIYFEPRNPALPNESLVSKETALFRIKSWDETSGVRRPIFEAGVWERDIVGGAPGVLVFKTGATNVTPQNKTKLSFVAKKLFVEETVWVGAGGGVAADPETAADGVSF